MGIVQYEYSGTLQYQVLILKLGMATYSITKSILEPLWPSALNGLPHIRHENNQNHMTNTHGMFKPSRPNVWQRMTIAHLPIMQLCRRRGYRTTLIQNTDSSRDRKNGKS